MNKKVNILTGAGLGLLTIGLLNNKTFSMTKHSKIKPIKLPEYKNQFGIEFVKIPPGEFMMGSNSYDGTKPIHKVTISKSFYMGKYEVTKEQWKEVMKNEPWKGRTHIIEDSNSPAVYVSWIDVQEFIKKLNKLTPETEKYRLPTEAEWEYSARAGTTTDYFFGDDKSELDKYAWYDKNAWNKNERYAHVVGQKLPNPWGLYDIYGNVDEFCQDCWHENYENAPKDGSAWLEENDGKCMINVTRGGDFVSPKSSCNSESRSHFDMRINFDLIGFRLALDKKLSIIKPNTIYYKLFHK